MFHNMVRCLAFRTPEYLPVAVRVVLHDAVLGALKGVELEVSLPTGAGPLLGGCYLE